MYYCKITLSLHFPDRQEVEFVGPGNIEQAIIDHREGNGAVEDDIAAWSPHSFVAVITSRDHNGKFSTKAISAEPLPHTEREVPVPETASAES